MSWLYVDSSTLVSIALTDPKRAPKAIQHIGGFKGAVTSELSRIECQAGLCSQLKSRPDVLTAAEQNLNRIFARMLVLSIGTRVVDAARTLIKRYRVAPSLRSADAIHIATANELRTLLGRGKGLRLEYLT